MNGGVEFSAESRNGTRTKLFVKQLPIRSMQSYLEAQKDEPALIELACTLDGKEVKAEFVDSLTNDCHAALIGEIERVNNDFFLQWGKRTRARAERLKVSFGLETPQSSQT